MNYIYLGDCLNVLRDNIKDESVDLIYIDPPFNSKRDYNIFFDDKEIQTQRIAFEDTWSLKSIQDSLQELHTMKTENLFYLLLTYQKVAPHAFPYLVMMSLRLVELHRVLKPTGSFYLHCDPTMSHYLKTVCDIVFGSKNYANEIIWQRINAKGNVQRKFGAVHDIIFRYAKNLGEDIWNQVYRPLNPEYVTNNYNHIEEETGRRYTQSDLTAPIQRASKGQIYVWKGISPPDTRCWVYAKEKMAELETQNRIIYTKNGMPRLKRYLDISEGEKIPDVWTDMKQVLGGEYLGYPTQKPKVLLERIIQASSNEGDTVLDGFCGCGTTVDAAESLHRNWIGIDISPIAISLIKRRLNDTYGKHLSSFEVRGTPTDEVSAIELWKQNPNAFQDWWLTEFEVFSTTFGSKGADKGIDGIGQYLVSDTQSIRVAFQVKGGKVQSKDIDALIGVLSKHKCELGVFLSIEQATKPMLDTTAQQGFVEFPGFQYPKIQILTLKDFFSNKFPKLPQTNITFKAAQFKGKKSKQIELGI
ncbi:MAG: restriction endonuclease [Ignavibacteriaceae bacterium]|jgi:DNA modification methylase|nr:restriction endonuclease [Ignavibacteriaceae bacterium]